MFLLNSRLGLFTVAGFHRRPFSRSYGTILPSSLTTVLSSTLDFSSLPPVSVCGTGYYFLPRSFSCQCEIICFATKFRSPSQPKVMNRGICLPIPSHCLDALFQLCAQTILLRHSIGFNVCNRYWNFNQLSIGYAFQPRLRSRLTLRGQACLRKPWVFGLKVSHLYLVTHANILSSIGSTVAFASASSSIHCSPTIISDPKLRYAVLAPVIFGANSLDQ